MRDFGFRHMDRFVIRIVGLKNPLSGILRQALEGFSAGLSGAKLGKVRNDDFSVVIHF
jgi:hypothetical protein